jgi:hypothetical protein
LFPIILDEKLQKQLKNRKKISTSFISFDDDDGGLGGYQRLGPTRLILRWDLSMEGREFQSLMPRSIVLLPHSDVEGTGLDVTKITTAAQDQQKKPDYALTPSCQPY